MLALTVFLSGGVTGLLPPAISWFRSVAVPPAEADNPPTRRSPAYPTATKVPEIQQQGILSEIVKDTTQDLAKDAIKWAVRERPAAAQPQACSANAVVNAAGFPTLVGHQNGGNIRLGPGTQFTPVNTVKNGGLVLVLAQAEGWTQVQICQRDANLPYGNLIGYMDSRFVQPMPVVQ
jgi:hypothetical protein